jgi:hypothetical protein
MDCTEKKRKKKVMQPEPHHPWRRDEEENRLISYLCLEDSLVTILVFDLQQFVPFLSGPDNCLEIFLIMFFDPSFQLVEPGTLMIR